jgi:integrase
VHKEVKVLQWPQVDWDSRSIRLEPGTTKNKDPRLVPFWNYPQLESLLKRQRAYTERVERAKSMIVPCVFHRGGKPIKGFLGAWEKACTQAGLPGAWAHDTRRCVVRRFELSHVPRGAAMKVIGHKTESVYLSAAVSAAGGVRRM